MLIALIFGGFAAANVRLFWPTGVQAIATVALLLAIFSTLGYFYMGETVDPTRTATNLLLGALLTFVKQFLAGLAGFGIVRGVRRLLRSRNEVK